MSRLFACFAAVLALASSTVSAQAPPPPPAPPVVVATGQATVDRAPDRAYVTFATESRAQKPDEAQKRNAEAMTRVQQAVRKAKIPAEAVRTLGFNLQEEADWQNGKRVPKGYLVSNAIEVRVDDLDDLGNLLDAAVQAGVTNVGGVRFDLKDRSGAEREALRMAVADARARADALAAGANVHVVSVLRIEEQGERTPPPMPMMRAMADAAPRPETPMSPGQIQIQASVTLTAIIEGR
jgi:uncharacterized protein YggE